MWPFKSATPAEAVPVIINLNERDLSHLLALLTEWRNEKAQEVKQLMGEATRAIAMPIIDPPDPRLQKASSLATIEGQLKAVVPYLEGEALQKGQDALQGVRNELEKL